MMGVRRTVRRTVDVMERVRVRRTVEVRMRVWFRGAGAEDSRRDGRRFLCLFGGGLVYFYWGEVVVLFVLGCGGGRSCGVVKVCLITMIFIIGPS